MHCAKSRHHRLIFHTAVFHHLSLEIMAAIKHFPALLWLRFPAVVRGTLCHFLLSLFPSFLRLFLCFLFACFSLLFIEFDLRQFLCYFPTSPSLATGNCQFCPLMFGNLFECQQLLQRGRRQGRGRSVLQNVGHSISELSRESWLINMRFLANGQQHLHNPNTNCELRTAKATN